MVDDLPYNEDYYVPNKEINIINKMTNEEKAKIYDELLRESDKLQRINSKLKSEYVGNIPQNIQEQINNNNNKIALLVGKLENLFR